jgi:hypothetical protein
VVRRLSIRLEDGVSEKWTARDLQALLPKPEPALDSHVLAAAIASLLAEFAFLPSDEQNAHAKGLFVAFDVNEDGGGLDRVVGLRQLLLRSGNQRLLGPGARTCRR